MTDVKDLTYKQAVTELEEIVEKMQSPECDIDNLNELTARALELLTFCKSTLTSTDKKLQEMLAKIEN